MKLPTAIFREYDIRGTVGDQLTAEVGRVIGQAVATLGWERLGRAPRLAVGRDNRPSGPALTHGLLSGIETVGGHGVDVGELPTPALYFATHVLNVDGGVQVTGSHNPPEFNGFKLVLGGEAVAGPDIQGLRRLIEEGRTPGRPGGGRSEDGSVLPRYRDAIVQRNGPLPRKVKVVVDCGNGVSSLIAAETLERLGGHAVIFDVKCSEVLPRELARAGLVPTMWKTGHSLIKQKMKETRAPLAGEMSGHMFFGGDWYGFDDALFAAARLLRYVADQGGPLSRLLADLPVTVATPELRVDCADDRKFEIVQRAAKHFASKYPVSTLDGVRITFAQGWGLLRASNTQPVLVLRFEAASESALASYRTEVESWLAAQSPRA